MTAGGNGNAPTFLPSPHQYKSERSEIPLTGEMSRSDKRVAARLRAFTFNFQFSTFHLKNPLTTCNIYVRIALPLKGALFLCPVEGG